MQQGKTKMYDFCGGFGLQKTFYWRKLWPLISKLSKEEYKLDNVHFYKYYIQNPQIGRSKVFKNFFEHL